MDKPSPMKFFKALNWIDGRPLIDVIDPYRMKIFNDVLYSFDDKGNPLYDMTLLGRGKKNWKSADLILAALYRFMAWPSPYGNDAYILANDEGQAKDDLSIAKKLIAVNPILDRELIIRVKEIERRGNRSVLSILPARDVTGSHGKTYCFIGFDEIHAYRNYDLLEALAPDPTRHDVLTWITSYNTIFNRPGIPLYDFIQRGKAGADPRMYFSWYAADYVTDPSLEDVEPEVKANPSMISWNNPGYLNQQKKRLPTHKYRRLHLNLPGMPEGAFLDVEKVMDSIVIGRKILKPKEGIEYRAFVDMSGGSSDDATLAIGSKLENMITLSLIAKQTGRPPFNPRDAVQKFAKILKEYNCHSVTGDRYAGETFRKDFESAEITYRVSDSTKHQLYEALEPVLNPGEIEILDHPKLQEQLLGLVFRGSKIDHLPGEHDDWANVLAGLAHSLKGFPARDFDEIVKMNDNIPIMESLKHEYQHEYH